MPNQVTGLNVTTSFGSGMMFLRWDEPNNGGSSINNYSIQYYDTTLGYWEVPILSNSSCMALITS